MSQQDRESSFASCGAPQPAWLATMQGHLATACVGRAVRYALSAPSTNDLAREWLDQGGPEGLLVVAAEQTAGRGRRGRVWVSPAGRGLYFSVGLRPGLLAEHATWLTFLGAVAVGEALQDRGIPVQVRWPNDLEVDGRKICGVLVETRLEGAAITSAIVGIGLNLDHQPGEFPPEIGDTAISVARLLGSRPAPGEVLGSILERLDHWYERLRPGRETRAGGRRLLERWMELAPSHRGEIVEVDRDGGRLRGVTEGVEDDGALRIRATDGTLVVVRLGDLRRLRAGGKEPR